MHTPLRILSADPGSTMMGLAITEISPDFKTLTVVDATTVNLAKLLNRNEQSRAELFGDKVTKLHILRQAVSKYAEAWEPLIAIAETPYKGRFAQAYAVLTECYSAIRLGLYDHNPAMVLNGIDPSSVKASVGVNGRSGDKELMRAALLNLPDLVLTIPLVLLDEHAIDAIAVGYSYFRAQVKP